MMRPQAGSQKPYDILDERNADGIARSSGRHGA